MMMDMGNQMKETKALTPVGEEPPKVSYPTLYLDKSPEDLMNKEIGEMCRLEVIVKIIGKRISDNNEGKKETIDLEIHQLGYMAKAGKKNKDEYLAMDEKAREAYDKEQIVTEKNKEDEDA
jgi:hypothetical protein